MKFLQVTLHHLTQVRSPRLGNLGLLVLHDSTFSHHWQGRRRFFRSVLPFRPTQPWHHNLLDFEKRAAALFHLFFPSFLEIRVLESESEISPQHGFDDTCLSEMQAWVWNSRQYGSLTKCCFKFPLSSKIAWLTHVA